jgi:signal transduction histidine kinase
MGIALGMAALLGAGMLWQIHRTWHAHLVRELDERGRDLAMDVSEHCGDLLRAGLAGEIPAALQHRLSQSPDAVLLVLERSDGAVVAEARSPAGASGSRIREQTAPVGDGLHRARVGMSTARVDHEVGWLTRRLAHMTAVIALAGVFAAWRLTRIFAQPIEELASLARTVKGGNYTVKAPVRANDEVGELAVAFNEMTDALRQKEAARQQLLGQVIRAGEEERKRIARELHDGMGQALTSQIAALSAIEARHRDEEGRRRLAELRQHAEQTLAEVHDLSVALRPSVLDDVGLMAALQRNCRMVAQRFGVDVACTEAGLDGCSLPPDVELTVYRLVQEALTNAVRHGQCSRAQVLVEGDTSQVKVVVQDNGRGFDATEWRRRGVERNRIGLLGIEERVSLLKGSFCVESQPGRGATVYATIPLEARP